MTIAAGPGDAGFQFRGVNHIAMVCADMGRTVDFYSGVLGMPLVKTIELPNDSGQHFFFDIGNGDCLAFFWFADAPPAAPGIASPRGLPTDLDFVTAIGSMNHLAFNIPADRFDDHVAALAAKGVVCSPVLNHDDSPWGVAETLTDDVFVRSVYFFDPDGILLELAAWTRPLTSADVAHQPRRSHPVA